MFTGTDGKASKMVLKCSLIVTDGKMSVDFGYKKSFMVICPNSISSNTGIDLKWPDNLSKMAVVDLQDLHLHGISWRLTDDSYIICNTSYRTDRRDCIESVKALVAFQISDVYFVTYTLVLRYLMK